MYDTARRVALVKKRVRDNTRRRQRRSVYGLSAACVLLFAALVQAEGMAIERGQTAAQGAFGAMLLREDRELAVISTEERCVVFHTAALNPKTTRSTQGVNVMTLKPKYKVKQLLPLEDTSITRPARYRARSLPIAGALLKEDDRGEQQMSLL